jgi:sensor histidine kinase YesM
VATLFPVWSLIGTLAYARHYLQDRHFGIEPRILPDLLGWMGCYYPWVLLTPVVFRLERRFPLGVARWPRHLGYLALVSLPLCYFASVFMITLSRGIRLVLGAPMWSVNAWWAFSAYEFLIAQALYWCTVVAAYVIRNLIQLHEQEQTAAQLALEKSHLETGLRQAELEALRARLNPHFLFNTLQNISVLTQQDPKTASRMLTRLGDMLRVVLRRDSQPETTLDAEIALTQAYVALEKMRFGDRLFVNFEAGPETRQALVPTFLLQPLVENAIVHGLKGAQRTGVIVVRGTSDGQDLILTVSDNGVGPPTEDLSEMKIGVGLGSTGERLERMYPDRHSLSMRRVPEGGTEVRITFPLRSNSLTAGTISNEYAPVVDR